VRYIMLKEEFWPLVRSGKKRITIRRFTRLKPGDEVYIHAGGKIVGEARILRVYEKTVDELSEEEAEKEGIPLPKLRKLISKMYGNGPLKIIEFELTRIYDPPLDPEELFYSKERPGALAKRILEQVEDIDPEARRILERLAETDSIRQVAMEMGGLKYRKKIRAVLRRYASLLFDGAQSSGE